MLVFIDDSGDPGFKLEKGSTRFFVIAMIIFDDSLEAERCALAIKVLRRRLKLSDDAEFRFFKSSHKVRAAFMEAIDSFKFRLRYLAVDKKLIRSPELKSNKNSFYAYFIKTALQHNGGTIRDARIKIDGSGNREFRKNFLTYLRRELNTADCCVVEQCKLVDSKENVLIQMADMVAGAVNRSLQKEKKYSDTYLKSIKGHVENPWNFK